MLVPASGMWRALFALLVLALGAWLGAGDSCAAEAPYVAAAADLKFALTEIAEAFARATGRQVKLSFGSSGNFARQIPQGAPFELFFSADEDYVLRLAQSGYALDRGVLYALGRIAVFVPHGSAVKADAELTDVAAAVNDGRITRFAIANPEHAPYGRAAREALQHAGIWERLQGRLVLGENASQAAQFATSGSAEGGIIPLSLAMAPALAAEGSYAVIPADWHKPLRQRMALLRGAGATARRFYEFVQQPRARAILDRYGFVLPPDGVR
jgi:molybdate transport system substrate-binding protein